MTNLSVDIVLTGYYFKDINLYDFICRETKEYRKLDFNLHILSHRSRLEIEPNLLRYLTSANWNVIFEANIGWDWGCHTQFIRWHSNQERPNPNFILFLHDDIVIKRNGFIDAFLNKADEGYKIIGNSRPFTKITSFGMDYPDEAYILNRHNIDYEPREISIVRGSAIFMDYDIARKCLHRLPYQKRGNINLANRSLRMFGAAATKLLGKNKIGYLSNDHFKSNYINEEMRGSSIHRTFFARRFIKSRTKPLLYIFERIGSRYILNHAHPMTIRGKYKISISDSSPRNGYLNILLNDSENSDINIKNLANLFSGNQIYRVSIKTHDTKNSKQQLANILKIANGDMPIDIFIEGPNLDKKAKRAFSHDFPQLKLSLEYLPSKTIFGFTKRLHTRTVPAHE